MRYSLLPVRLTLMKCEHLGYFNPCMLMLTNRIHSRSLELVLDSLSIAEDSNDGSSLP